MSDELPSKWDQWPRDAKVDYLSLQQTRAELLAHLRGFLGSNRTSDRLSKRELAQISVDLEVQR